jgi:poly(3-hydroxyalkanoate) synthetase
LVNCQSPTNFFATNPEAIKLAVETGGASVFQGMTLFLDDLAKGRVTMTDEGAFTVGTNIATTEGSVVFQNDLIQLIQYAPRTEQVHARPLVIVPPCINKFYILDLQPENSFVRYAIDQGHTVFVVSGATSTRAWTPHLGRLPRARRDSGDRRRARDHQGRPREHAGLLRRRHAARVGFGGDDRVGRTRSQA